MNNTPFISQTKLNVLFERVCSPISFLTTKNDSSADIWDTPINMCQQIEKELMAVDSVIIEAKKQNEIFKGTNAIRFFHAILCRVYIILYYRHRDEKLYQEIVFSRLKANMGVYSNNHLRAINDQIDHILAQEKLIEEVQAKKKKEEKPVFAYVFQNGIEQDRLYIEYNEEKLFRCMAGIIRGLSDKHNTHLDEANVWYNAKIVVHTLRDVNRPELLIRRAATALAIGQIYSQFYGSQIILICVYAMVLASKVNTHFTKFIQKMESLSDADTDLIVIKETISALKSWITKNLPFDDYDYIGESQKPEEMFSKADVDRIAQQYVAKIEELNYIVEKKDDIIAEYKEKASTIVHEEDGEEEKEQEDVLYNKVKYEFFLLLLEASRFDINKTGNKSRAGELWHMFTGKSGEELRRFCSTRRPINNHTKSDVDKLNKKLLEMGINIQISSK